jgi:multisubunit Na+/H+ antiporter MnhG subunit
MKNVVGTLLPVLGLIVFVFGTILPSRLPDSQRNYAEDTVATILGIGLGLVPAIIYRKKRP